MANTAEVGLDHFFTRWLPERFAQRTDLSARLANTAAIAQVQLDGEDGGIWHLIIDRGNVGVETGPHESPSFTVKMAVQTFSRLRTKELDPKLAFLTGKIKVNGSLATAMKLVSLLQG